MKQPEGQVARVRKNKTGHYKVTLPKPLNSAQRCVLINENTLKVLKKLLDIATALNGENSYGQFLSPRARKEIARMIPVMRYAIVEQKKNGLGQIKKNFRADKIVNIPAELAFL